jgi:hypothetical protein
MTQPLRWWETRWFALAAILLAAVPMLWPALPPLTDLPGHVGRYHVAAQIGDSPWLQRHWSYDWALIGNLGVDLLVLPLTQLLGAELAAKLVVGTIPSLTVAALIWLSREGGNGRLSPAAPLAFPLAYSYPLQFGFVNFALAAALAIAALALWLRLARQKRLVLRALLFVPISLLLWMAHSFGWAMFGLFAFAAETMTLRGQGKPWLRAGFVAGLRCTTLALPLVPMLTGGASGGGGLGIGYEWLGKLTWIASLLRERWKWYDTACAVGLFCFAWAAVRNASFRLDRPTAAAAAIGFAAWLLLPYALLGGAYVDMRMLPFALAVLLVAVRVPAAPRLERGVALAALAFFALRITTTTIAFVAFGDGQAAAARIAERIPHGAGVLVLVQQKCEGWSDDRLAHIAGLALVRRDIFDNSEWTLPGQQLLRGRHPQAGALQGDPSQLIYDGNCRFRPTIFAEAVRGFDRGTFGYVWTVGMPAYPRLAPDLALVARDGPSVLYRVLPRGGAQPRLQSAPPLH